MQSRCARFPVLGARYPALGVDSVPGIGSQVPGIWNPYLVPIPEGKAGIPAECAGFMFRKTRTQGMQDSISACILLTFVLKTFWDYP